MKDKYTKEEILKRITRTVERYNKELCQWVFDRYELDHEALAELLAEMMEKKKGSINTN